MELSERVKWVLDSDISGYTIFKQTGVSQSVISRLRKEQGTIANLSVGNAEKIAQFYEADVIDTLARGEEAVADIKKDMVHTFREVLESQLDLINDQSERTTSDIRMYHVLETMFERTLLDNEAVASLVPAYKNTSTPDVK